MWSSTQWVNSVTISSGEILSGRMRQVTAVDKFDCIFIVTVSLRFCYSKHHLKSMRLENTSRGILSVESQKGVTSI